MRVGRWSLIVAGVCVCAGATSTAARSAADAAPLAISADELNAGDSLCVIHDGQIANVEVTILPSGDTLVEGKAFRLVYPPVAPAYAGLTDWFGAGAPIFFQGHRYVKDRLPLHIYPREIRRAGEYEATPVFIGRDDPDAPVYDVLFIPVQPGCIFQAYVSRGSL